MICKVVIVDDDRIIRRSLTTAIQWEKHGFQVAGEAADGEKGLELIQKVNPQVVISDIKMPYMDGLVMAEHVKKTNPCTKVILLTGFEDFSFAQKAISIRAFDYLLKPVDREALLSKVQEARTEWEREQQEQQQLNEHRPLKQQKIIQGFLYGKISADQFKEEAADTGIKLDGPSFYTFLVKMDDWMVRQLEKEDQKKQLLALAEKHFQTAFIAEVRAGEFAFVLSAAPSLAFEKKAIQLFQREVRRCFNWTVTITAGQPCEDIGLVPDAYSEAAAVMEFRHIIGKDCFFTIEDVSSTAQEEQPVLQQLFHENIVEKVNMGLVSQVEQFFSEERLNQLKNTYLPLQDLQITAIHLVVLLSQSSGQWKQQRQKELAFHIQDINKAQTVQEVCGKLAALFIEAARTAGRQFKKRSVVDEAVAYIEVNFCDEELTLQKTAEYIHVNAAYLSSQFKAEKGINFVDFLISLRMQKAMQLLRQEQLKIYEVASRVGYSNPQYFSICFKQYTSYSPGQFKKLS